MKKPLLSFGICLLLALAAASNACAQICRPVSERTVEVGCWITAHAKLAELPRAPVFWHLDTYSTIGEAEGAKGPRGTVLESLGQVWLLTIDVAGWHPQGGKRVAEIGPLPVNTDAKFSAQYIDLPGFFVPIVPVMMALRQRGAHEEESIHGRANGRGAARGRRHVGGRDGQEAQGQRADDAPGASTAVS